MPAAKRGALGGFIGRTNASAPAAVTAPSPELMRAAASIDRIGAERPAAGSTPTPKRRQRRTTKDGKEQRTIYVHPEGWRELELLAIAEDTDCSALAREGLNMLLRARGRPPVA
jgi:hypothetical protein